MKNHKTKKNGNGQSQAIRIEFTHAVAATVSIAGTFNDWRPDATPMVRVDQGRWIKDIALPPGTYEYRLVVDGVWIPDPAASETVPNPFGEQNSVLKVNRAAPQAKL
jgi:1,4-alpha-glucan branching enzyme